MKHNKLVRLVIAACACAALMLALAGCTAQNAAVNDEQAANRQYMSSVNESMDELASRLESFEDAVSRNDAVTMRTQADNAFKTLDTLANIEAPEALKDVRQGYIDGCNALKDALNAYIDLYTEIDSATDEHPFDYATYAERLQSIQDQYNDGIEKLKAADQKASEL